MHRQRSQDWLIQRAVERDKAAFATLYDSCIDQVYRHVYYRVSNRIDAEDITQEVFIRAWKAIDKYKKTGAPFVAWLLAIAHNLIVDHYRARKNLVSLEQAEVSNPTAETSPEAMAEASLNKDYVRDAVLKLKGEKQKVILMRFIDGLSYREIAKALGKSEGAVRVIQYRALNDLRQVLARSE
jgi:RNA polymerase sigma-70 factor (ECF subfamily)